MKKVQIIIILLIFGVALGLMASAPAWAKSERVAVTYLIEEGKKCYQKGDFKGAIEKFYRVLLADPDNKKAQRYLEKLAPYQDIHILIRREKPILKKVIPLSYKRQYSETKELTLALEGVQKSLLELPHQELAALKAERDALMERNLARETELKRLQGKLEHLTKQVYAKTTPPSKPLQTQEASKVRDELSSYQDQLHALKAEYQKLETELLTKDIENRKIYNLVEDYAYLRKNALGELEDQLHFKEKDLSKRSHLVLEKTGDVLFLWDRMEAAQERFLTLQAELNKAKAVLNEE